MGLSSTPLIILSCILLLSSAASAFNITRLLSKYPGYNTFNDLLTQTKLNEEINHRLTITVLAVQDGAISSLSGKPLDVVKRILSSHVVLDYYDLVKLKNLKKGTTLLTTLYQTTGVASTQQGFLNVTAMKNGDIVFGSAVKDASLDVTLKASVASQPYNISVLEVSGPIIAPGIDSTAVHPPAASPPKKSVAPAPAPLKKKKKAASPAESPVEAEAPVADAPTDAPASTPAEAPAADTPAADAPASDATPVDAAPAPSTSSAGEGSVVSFWVGSAVALVAAFLAAQ